MKKNIAILLFPEVELLDFAGPLETLAIAREIDGGNCYTVGSQRDIVTKPSELKVTADYLLDDAPRPDVLIVPGGSGASKTHPHTAAVVAYISDAARAGALITSVCTGTFLLGAAGLLDGRDCTTHKRYRERLTQEYPRARIHAATVVASGDDLVTAANVSSGIDLAIYLAQRFYGAEHAGRIADGLNFATRQREILEFDRAPSVGVERVPNASR